MTPDSQFGTILVVDDNHEIRGFTKMFLEKAGYTVATASDGEEGFRYYQEHRSDISMLLTDVAMPKIGGYQLVDRVLAIDSQLPILFMSGDAFSGYRGLECVAKPFGPAELVERVSRVLTANAHP
jgi:DNA-binding response OmpR family regulator